MKKTKIGVVGCGDISGIYLTNLTTMFANTEVIGVCDLVPDKAKNAQDKYNIPRIYKDMHELFADPEVEIVLNITRPYEHHGVSMAAIAAGKHVYAEKPLGATLAEGVEIRDAAKARGVMLGGAPDTFLGAGAQTCRKLIDDGYIGDVVGGTAFFGCPGHERWHPDPAFYYAFGGGPILDMGPYYITTLVSLLGPVQSVAGMTKKTHATRVITSAPKFGEVMEVVPNTHASSLLSFLGGAIVTLTSSFDVHAHNQPVMEIYGTKGTLVVPDPNTFDGPVRLYTASQQEFLNVPLTFSYRENSRGLGLADMAAALSQGRPARAGIGLYHHVLEVMEGIATSCQSKQQVCMTTAPSRPEPMKAGQLPGVVE